jgi:phytoene synthase
MEMDLNRREFLNFNDLYEYCLCVASTVGLIFISIMGNINSGTIEYAINLGVALQLTNILRDVRKDALNGRIYIPKTDLEMFQYTKEDIINNEYNDNFKNLMKFEIQRTKSFYEKAHLILKKSDFKIMLPARIMDSTYYNILKKIEKFNYNIYTNDIRLSKFRKIFVSFHVYFNTILNGINE